MAPNADLNSLLVRRKVMRMCLHCADVSNPAKSFVIYEQWANLVMEEFYEQGDRERTLNIPISPFYDRNNKQMAKCQLGFIKFIVRPLYCSFTELCRSLKDEILGNIDKNQKEWEKRKDHGSEVVKAAGEEANGSKLSEAESYDEKVVLEIKGNNDVPQMGAIVEDEEENDEEDSEE